MSDNLEMVVVRCNTDYDSTRLVLGESQAEKSGVFHEIEFLLPIVLQLKPGDRIQFYLGTTTNYNAIYHGNYARAFVYRKDEETPFLSFDGIQMKLLEEIKEAVLYR